MPAFERRVNDAATLTGRSLEPWRAILALALWLDGQGVSGLWQRMEALSLAYQSERPDLEAGDLTALVVLAAACANRADLSNGANLEGDPGQWILETSEVTAAAKKIAAETESTLSADQIDSRRVGMVLNKMRIKKPPRPGGKGRRKWEVSRTDLVRWSLAYGIALPDPLRAGDEPSLDTGSWKLEAGYEQAHAREELPFQEVGTVGEVGPVGTWEEGEL